MINFSVFKDKKSKFVFNKKKIVQWVLKRIGWKNSFKLVRFMARKKLDGRVQKIMKSIAK